MGARAVGARAGLEDVATAPSSTRHLDAVWERLGVNDALLGPQRPAAADAGEAPSALGWAFSVATRNADPGALRPGDRRLHRLRRPVGRQAARRCATYLAGRRSTRGAEHRRALHASTACWSRTAARRASTARGRPDDRARAARSRSGRRRSSSPRGALESPALLLRSGIGGPAVGQLPAPAPEHGDVRQLHRGPQAWWGAPHARARRRVRVRRRATATASCIEGAQYTTGARRLGARRSRRRPQHKERWSDFRHGGDVHRAACATAAHGRVDDRRRRRRPSVPTRSTDPRRRRHDAPRARRAGAPARGGRRATRSRDPAPRAARPGAAATTSRRFIARLRSACRCGPAACGCSPPTRWARCRMGTDPATRVADPRGELHDTPGVWIGDASAFPTAVGHQPDDLDHGARPPHRRARSRRAAGAAARRRPPRRPDQERRHGVAHHRSRPRPALHRRRVGRARRPTTTIDVVNASTEEVMGRIPRGHAEDVDRAVAAARARVRRPGRRRRSTSAPSCARRDRRGPRRSAPRRSPR